MQSNPPMIQIRLLTVTLLSLCLAGCAFYNEPSSSQPHARVMFQAATGLAGALGGQAVTPLEINGLVPNEYAKWNFRSFKVSPGATRLLLSIGTGRVVGMAFVEFDAVAGRTYKVASHSKDILFLVTVTDDKRKVVGAGISPKTTANPYRNAGQEMIQQQPFARPYVYPAR